MLQIFRTYQKYIYLVVTVVIIISFSFFGTYSAFDSVAYKDDKVAFTAVDGTAVSQREVGEMALFLGTDREDKRLFGGVWGPNFLNDGVLVKDFFQTGLAEILVKEYADVVREDLQKQLLVEKRYEPYEHPQVPFLSAKGVWSYVAPEINASLEELKKASDATSKEAFRARVSLFLGQKTLPPPVLREVLRNQEQQQSWIPADPELDRTDLFLFGYRFLEDWFGPRFVRLSAQFIINAAKIAESRGYSVSEDEALASLVYAARTSFEESKGSPGVRSSDEYFREQLRRMGISQNVAVKVWRRVMLFRRLFYDFGDSTFVDPFSYKQYLDVAQEFVKGDFYRLPKSLRLENFRDLQELQTYLDLVGDSSELTFPRTFLSVEKVKSLEPELIKKRYLVDLSHVEKRHLEGRVGVKEALQWELEASNWEELKQEFPVLGTKNGEDRELRLSILESLDNQTRSMMDAFVRNRISTLHPEWIDQDLEIVVSERTELVFDGNGNTVSLETGNAAQDLQQQLDREGEVARWSGDEKNFYRIQVVDQSPGEEILTFAEAKESGILRRLVKKNLQKHYELIREEQGDEFKKADGSWKDLDEVEHEVAKDYYSPLLESLEQVYKEVVNPKVVVEEPTPHLLAAYRCYPYVQQARAEIMNNPESTEWHREEDSSSEDQTRLTSSLMLDEQWKLVSSEQRLERGDRSNFLFDVSELFSLSSGSWSELHVPVNGDITFFHLSERGVDDYAVLLAEKVGEVHHRLSDEAKRVLMEHLLLEIKAKRAISLDYLNRDVQEVENPS